MALTVVKADLARITGQRSKEAKEARAGDDGPK
jgi:hypothetical protein